MTWEWERNKQHPAVLRTDLDFLSDEMSDVLIRLHKLGRKITAHGPSLLDVVDDDEPLVDVNKYAHGLLEMARGIAAIGRPELRKRLSYDGARDLKWAANTLRYALGDNDVATTKK